jgi:hypothetical protein
MCRDESGNTISNNGELGNGCVGMPFDVEYMVLTIDVDCLSGGSGSGGSGFGASGSGGIGSGGSGSGGSGSGGGGSSSGVNIGTPNTGNPPSGGNTDNPTYANPTLTDGDGNPILTTPILTIYRKNHIEELNKITTQNEIGTNGLRNYIDQLVEDIDDSIEQGMEFKLNANGSYSAYPAQSSGFDFTAFYPVSINNPSIRIHKHHNELNPIFSAEDVLGMVQFFIQKKNLNPNSSDNNNITSIMVSEDGIHALRVSNPTELIEFNSYYSTPENKNAFTTAYKRKVIIKSKNQCGGTCSDEEYKDFLFQNFLAFFKEMIWGIDFYYSPHPVNNDENYEWTKQN